MKRTIVAIHAAALLVLISTPVHAAFDTCTVQQATISVSEAKNEYVPTDCDSGDPYVDVTLTYACTECGQGGNAGTQDVHGAGAVWESILGCKVCRPWWLSQIPGPETNIYRGRMYLGSVGRRGLTYYCQTGSPINVQITCPCPRCDNTPIIIPLTAQGIRLTSAEEGVAFDLDADGIAEQLAWTDPGTPAGFLALDRDGNGWIDSGVELFGNKTPQPATDEQNGFNALSMYDLVHNGGNGDGIISSDDNVYSSLRLWVDSNHDGTSDEEEITTLVEAGITSIDLDYRQTSRVDRHGNSYLFWSFVETSSNEQRRAWDVTLVEVAE